MVPLPATSQILVVDDDPSVIELLFRTLASDEFDLVVANNGERGLEIAHEDPPDLILLDIAMPGLDGLEVCKRLKEDPATRSTPVIFMTAHSALERRVQAFQLGAADFVRKPFDVPELVARIRTQLSLGNLMKILKRQNAQLQSEVQQRVEGEERSARLTHDLLKRTEELHQAKKQLEAQFAEREVIEKARSELQERIIAVQRQRLAELSTPLIPITHRLIVMPLIGTMDAERMKQVMETALDGAATRRAGHMILDITGLADVEAGVVAMLVRIANGLRLLGTYLIVTGIGPDVARKLVTFNVSLGSLVTKATLQEGIAYAMQAQDTAQRRVSLQDG